MVPAVRVLGAILALPFVVLVVVPAILAWTGTLGGVHPGWGLGWPWAVLPVLLGLGLVVLGLTLMARTIGLFARVGEGTLAPWDPPTRFVAEGVYRHVRNPMISGVLCVLLGEAAVLGSWAQLAWFACFLAVNAIYIPAMEEPGLVRRFGDDYVRYRTHVPRWIPRRTPWDG